MALPFAVLLCSSMTQTVTHTGMKAYGTNGHKGAGKSAQPQGKGLKTTGNRPLYPPTAAHNPKARGSNPAPATNQARAWSHFALQAFSYLQSKCPRLGQF